MIRLAAAAATDQMESDRADFNAQHHEEVSCFYFLWALGDKFYSPTSEQSCS